MELLIIALRQLKSEARQLVLMIGLFPAPSSYFSYSSALVKISQDTLKSLSKILDADTMFYDCPGVCVDGSELFGDEIE